MSIPEVPRYEGMKLTVGVTPRYGGTKLIVCVTGDRNWEDGESIYKVLSREHPQSVVMQGGAHGADVLADIAAVRLGMPRGSFPYFGCYGRAGGPIRNQFMVSVLAGLRDQGWGVKVHAFHDNIKESKGTLSMIRECRRVGLEVKLHGHKKQA